MKNKIYINQILIASIIAAVASGIPSTTYFIISGQNILLSIRAIGLIFFANSYPDYLILFVSACIHLMVSLFWCILLKLLMPQTKPLFFGIMAGIVIAVVDILLIGSHIPAIEHLAFLPQLADHILWGLIVTFIYSQNLFYDA